ncbi:hypothetical protein [Isoptericola sp. NPDC055881]
MSTTEPRTLPAGMGISTADAMAGAAALTAAMSALNTSDESEPTPAQVVERAMPFEQHISNALRHLLDEAIRFVDVAAWNAHGTHPVLLTPHALHRLENAVANLRATLPPAAELGRRRS